MRTKKKLAVEKLERREVFTAMPGVEGFVDVSDPEMPRFDGLSILVESTTPSPRDATIGADARVSMPDGGTLLLGFNIGSPTVVQGDTMRFDRGFLSPSAAHDETTSHSLKHPVDATGMPIGECVAAVEQVFAEPTYRSSLKFDDFESRRDAYIGTFADEQLNHEWINCWH